MSLRMKENENDKHFVLRNIRSMSYLSSISALRCVIFTREGDDDMSGKL